MFWVHLIRLCYGIRRKWAEEQYIIAIFRLIQVDMLLIVCFVFNLGPLGHIFCLSQKQDSVITACQEKNLNDLYQ